MFPIVFMVALPYLLAQAGRFVARRYDGSELGADPAPAPAAAAPVNPMMMTPQGQAFAFATSPQGQALGKKGLARGLKLVKSAKKGNPKAKKRVKVTKAKARAGDPKAQKELRLIKAGAVIDAAQEEA